VKKGEGKREGDRRKGEGKKRKGYRPGGGMAPR